jgi:hypothetical protein
MEPPFVCVLLTSFLRLGIWCDCVVRCGAVWCGVVLQEAYKNYQSSLDYFLMAMKCESDRPRFSFGSASTFGRIVYL